MRCAEVENAKPRNPKAESGLHAGLKSSSHTLYKMADICTLCQHEFQNFPRIELACHHSFHTHCFLANLGTVNPQNIPFLQCTTCEQPLFAQHEEGEEVEETFENQSVASTHSRTIEETRVSNLWETNPTFRKDIKEYIKTTRSVSKPRLAFQRLLKTKKTELQPIYSQIKAQYEGLYNVKKNDIMSSNEYKEFRSAEAKVARYWTLLREKYDVRSYSIHGLRDKRGCKTIHRPNTWRGSPKFIIRHALRLRLPYF